MNGRSTVVLDSKGRDAMVTKQHGSGHPNQAAANDQYWNFVIGQALL
jgi:hypothetical protein